MRDAQALSVGMHEHKMPVLVSTTDQMAARGFSQDTSSALEIT